MTYLSQERALSLKIQWLHLQNSGKQLMKESFPLLEYA